MTRYAMIMAGGAGTRLWPLSRGQRPKQLLPLGDGRTLLEHAWRRLDGLIEPARRIICANETHRAAMKAVLPELDDAQFLGEPIGRDTVNAIGLTAAVLAKRDPDAVFAVLTSDHLITPGDRFRETIARGFELVEADSNRLVTFGIEATSPSRAMGWVELGEPIGVTSGAFTVPLFREKPDEAEADAFFASRRFRWNSGMFVFHAGRFLEVLEKFKPENHAALIRIAAAWDGPDREHILAPTYPSLYAKSVDYVIMEPASRNPDCEVCTVNMDLSWTDVGSWKTYAATLDADDAGNRANTRAMHLDSRNVTTIADDSSHLIVTIGCENLIIVRTRDATFVCPADQADRMKELVEQLEPSDR